MFQLSVVENAVIIVDAVGGVEFQTQKVWELAMNHLPRIISSQTGSGTRKLLPRLSKHKSNSRKK